MHTKAAGRDLHTACACDRTLKYALEKAFLGIREKTDLKTVKCIKGKKKLVIPATAMSSFEYDAPNMNRGEKRREED